MTNEAERATEESQQLVGSLVETGLAWARYGLTVGRMALETSAKSLQVTAGALGKLADNLEPAESDDQR